MKFLAILALIALIAAALAQPAHNIEDILVEPEDVDDLCELVGRHSGCSGCVLGTKKLCTFVSWNPEVNNGKKRAYTDQEPLEFGCISTATFKEDQLEEDSIYEDASLLCPADATKEPIIRGELVNDNDDVLPWEVTSTMNTTWFTNELAEFSVQPWAVDRFSLFGTAGFALMSGLSETEGGHYDCAYLNSRYLQDPSCSPIIDGEIQTPKDKYCVKTILAGYLSLRCPQYGVAVSGVCESTLKTIWRSCSSDSLTGEPNVRPDHDSPSTWDEIGLMNYNSQAKFLHGAAVVPDDTPFCLRNLPVQPSGELEDLYGLNYHMDEEDNDYFDFDDTCE